MTRQRLAAGVIGVGLALVPSAVPFLAVGWIGLSGRLRSKDTLWIASAVLFLGLDLARGHVSGTGLLVLLGWLISRGSEGVVRRFSARQGLGESMGAGILVGLVIAVLVACIQAAMIGRGLGTDLARDPNLFGHALFGLSAIGASLLRGRWLRFALGAVAVVGALAAESRSTLIAFAAFAIVATLAPRLRSTAAGIGAAAALGIAVLALLGTSTAWSGRFVNGASLLASPGDFTRSRDQNVFRASENLTDGAWKPLGVEVRQRGFDKEGATEWLLTKKSSENYARLQQTVRIRPASTYVFRMEYKSSTPDAHPGLLGWAANGESVRAAVVDGSLHTSMAGSFVSLGGSVDRDGAWTTLTFRFRSDSADMLPLSIGPAPDLRRGKRTERLLVRHVQLARGALNGAYVPTEALRNGQGSALIRWQTWRVALQGIYEQPWLGHGTGTFRAYFKSRRSGGGVVPTHAHNLFLESAFERGIPGAFAVMLLLVAWIIGTPGRSRVLTVAALAAVLTANVVDSTLLTGPVFYPLSLLVGGAAGRTAIHHKDQSSAETARMNERA